MANIYNLTFSLCSYLNGEYGPCRQTHALDMCYNGTKYQHSPLWETETQTEVTMQLEKMFLLFFFFLN